jgi:hypothetical protein
VMALPNRAQFLNSKSQPPMSVMQRISDYTQTSPDVAEVPNSEVRRIVLPRLRRVALSIPSTPVEAFGDQRDQARERQKAVNDPLTQHTQIINQSESSSSE